MGRLTFSPILPSVVADTMAIRKANSLAGFVGRCWEFGPLLVPVFCYQVTLAMGTG